MVTTAGEAMACLAAPEPGPLALGGSLALTVAGAEANVAIALARLGHEVAWIGRLGDDQLGEVVLRTLRGEGVDVGRVRRDGSAPTGLMIKERRLGTRTRVHYYRAGSAGSRLEPDDVEGDADLVHLTGITPALGPGPRAAVEALASHATTLSFDVNFRSRLWPSPAAAREALTPFARRATVVFADPGELELVGGAGALLEAGVEVVVGQARRGRRRGRDGRADRPLPGACGHRGRHRRGRRRALRRLPVGQARRPGGRRRARPRGPSGGVRGRERRRLGGAAAARRARAARRRRRRNRPLVAGSANVNCGWVGERDGPGFGHESHPGVVYRPLSSTRRRDPTRVADLVASLPCRG
jgi:2-dehydro-3-deoxygluconokinase